MLKEHFTLNHKSAKKVRKHCCEKCDFSTDILKNFDKHFAAAHETKRECPLCKFETRDKIQLNIHLESEHQEKEYHLTNAV